MKQNERPNILFVMTDQQSARMMSCAGNTWLHTPAMDRIAARGVRFERAYCTNPVCVPSRFSLFTGRRPSAIGLRSNASSHIEYIPPSIMRHGMGHQLRRAGYRTVYAGKQHLPRMNAEDMGFEVPQYDERNTLAAMCAAFLDELPKEPWLLVASFINPHDICYHTIRAFASSEIDHRLLKNGRTELAALDQALELPQGMSEADFFATCCPPAPPNLEPQQDEPEALAHLIDTRAFRRRARDTWTAEDWRRHGWAYARLTEQVDAQIGRVLDALDASGQRERTLVVFTSDHGELNGAHRMEHKTAFYEEAARIPLILCLPDRTVGMVDSEHVVSNGLDLLPTLCEAAGLEAPSELEGRSLLPLLRESASAWDREFIPVESEIGRMVVSARYKYARYDHGARSEQLYDLRNDPYEMRNSLHDPDLQDVVEQHRAWWDQAFSRELELCAVT